MKRLIASLLAFEMLLVFVHLAVYRTLIEAFGTPPGSWGTLLAWIFVLLAFTFISATLIARYSRSRAAAAYYAFSAYWFGLINFLFAGSFAFFATISILYPLNIYVAPALLAGIALSVAFLVHCYGTWNGSRGEITRVSVALSNLPAAWKGRKVVFITDVHLGDVLGAEFAVKIAKKISALEPYALFIGGDLYDGPACNEKKVLEPFRALAHGLPGGAWFVTGNHEYYMADTSRVLEAVRGVGIRILNNEATDMEGMQLIGVDDSSTHNEEELKKVLAGIPIDNGRPSILLKHVPLNLVAAADKGISLELCGHTHQGQIFPFSLLTKRIYDGFDYGLKSYGAMQVYTSSGVGTWGPPLRLGTRSEIVLIELTASTA